MPPLGLRYSYNEVSLAPSTFALRFGTRAPGAPQPVDDIAVTPEDTPKTIGGAGQRLRPRR